MILDEKIIADIKKASGYGYGWNLRKKDEFELIFGFNPLKYPQYFKLSESGYIVKTRLFINHCNAIFSQSKLLIKMLTES